MARLVINPRFDTFKSPLRDNSIAAEYFQLFTPINSIKTGSPIMFSINPSKNFIDFKKTKIRIEFAIKNAAGDLIVEDDGVSTAPNMLSSLFKSVQITINNTTFSENSSLYYPYSAYLSTVQNKSPYYFLSVSDGPGFYHDRNGFFADHVFPQQSSHVGQWFRHLRVLHGVTDVCGYLLTDLTTVESFLPGDLTIHIKLDPSSSDFFLLQREQDDFHVEILSAELYVRYVQPTDIMYNSYERALSERAAIFPYVKTSIRSYTVPIGVTNFNLENILYPSLPSTVTAVLIANDRLIGSKSKSPFRFQHHHLSYCSLMLEGTLINGYAFTPDFAPDKMLFSDILTSYYSDKGVDAGTDSRGTLLSMPQFEDGFFLLKWEISDAIKRTQFNSDNRAGVSRMTFRFTQQIEEPMNVIIFTSTNTYFEIDKHRTIKLSPEAI